MASLCVSSEAGSRSRSSQLKVASAACSQQLAVLNLAPCDLNVSMSQGDKNNPYLVIERHLIPEVLAGCERFWR